MIRISNIKLLPGEEDILLRKKAAKKLHVAEKEISAVKIIKRSLDARKKDHIFYSYTIEAEVKNEERVLAKAKDKDVQKEEAWEYRLPEVKGKPNKRPVIAGFGPAGMFCALLLAQMGLRPIVLERGEDVDSRTKSVERFWREGILNPSSNVQFGEGGAGTFSDGKLTSRSKDRRGLKVLEELAAAGGPEEILYDAKPHIGTDLLKGIVKNIREKIISLGGDVLFRSQMTDIQIEEGTVRSVTVNGHKIIPVDYLVLALGHSARDTFELLDKKGFQMEQKPFAVGVRIEHPQSMIDLSQYGMAAGERDLGAAEYRLACKTQTGRNVYTFCMCPGGYVVAAASEEGRVCTNGMSEYKRDGQNANSALLVQVFPEDFQSNHPLGGMYWQRKLEEAAFLAGGENYKAPAQYLGDFMGQTDGYKKETDSTYRPGVVFTNLEEVLPPLLCDSLREAIAQMGKKLKGFDRPDAVLTAVESRSSSPVRILRGENGESMNVKGVYPAGEGAGYAGGIVSAAIDGMIAAEKIAESINEMCEKAE